MALDINGLNSSQTNTGKTKAGGQIKERGGGSAESGRPDTSGSPKDTVNLSPEAKALNQVQEQVSSEPSINEARVAEIRERIQDGSYKVDPERNAQGLLDADNLF